MAKRSYSDNEKASILAALDANAGNVKRTAREFGIAHTTLADWAKNRHVTEDVTEIRTEKKRELADWFEDLTRKGLENLELNIASAKFSEVSLAVCQWTDKMRLLRNESTSITETKSTDREWAEKQLVELMTDCKMNREQALQVMTENAPTVAKWLM
jgi:transposase-like protein